MVQRVLTLLARSCTGLGALALLVMMLATDYDIVARAAWSSPLHGVVDIVEITVLLVAFLGLPEAFLRDEQIRVDLVDSFLAPRAISTIKLFGLILTIGFLAVLAIDVFSPMLDAYRFGDLKPDVGLPTYPLFAVILFALLASIATSLVLLGRVFGGSENATP